MSIPTLTFNRVHKNGWMSWKMPGVTGAIFIDKRMLTPEAIANPPQTLEEALNSLVAPGEGATEAQAAKAAKKLELENKKAERASQAAAKATERLEKLKAQAAKAQALADAARAKAAGGVSSMPQGAEQAASVEAL